MNDAAKEIDWRALFVEYVKTVVADDYVVGLRCLQGWANAKQSIMMEIHKEVWPTDFLGPWSEEKYKNDRG